jgi:hypothetical protein
VPDARIIAVCDAIVTRLQTVLSPAAPDEVARKYLAPVKAETLRGRKVYVFPVRYSDAPASRAENLTDYTVAVLVVERYEDAGEPTDEWIDERVNFAESVYHALDFGGGEDLLAVESTREVWCETADAPVYDVEMLSTKKLFWAELEFLFREINA